jgi:hypothetical protein
MQIYEDALDPTYPLVITVYVRMDPKYFVYNRKVYSILEALGDVGGLYQMLFLIGLLIVSFFSKRLFVSSILKEIY